MPNIYTRLVNRMIRWLAVGGMLLASAFPHSLRAQCEDNGTLWEESWVSCTLTPNPNASRPASHWILFEFDEAQSIDSTHIWNANRTGELNQGIKTAEIDYSTDGNTWVNLGTFSFPQATGAIDYEGFQGPALGGIFVQKILLTVTETYGNGSCASLAEIRFDIDPDACYGTVDACGICDGEGESVWYIDEDGDGLGSPNVVLTDCAQPAGYVENKDDACDNGLIGWDQISNLFQENGCMGCHGTGGAGGLKLTSYDSAMVGGNKCGTGIFAGTALVDIIMVDNYQGCGQAIGFPAMNERVGGLIDSTELALIQQWVDGGAVEDCRCEPGAADADADGVCDMADECPGFDNTLIGTPCDDGSACTSNDVWTSACKCEGTPETDTDADGICDIEDQAPNNPCTADGTIDGAEPDGWTPQPANDCDQDEITFSGGDMNDFEACIDQFGSRNTADCACGIDAIPQGGTVSYSIGFNNAHRADSLPDSLFSNGIGNGDTLQIMLPYLSKGEEVCVTTRFQQAEGKLRVDINGSLYSFLNTDVGVDQEKCLTTLVEGEQLVTITDNGSGVIYIDGTSFSHCPCSDSASVISNSGALASEAYTLLTGWQILTDNIISVCDGDSLVLGMGPDKGLSYTWSGPLIGSLADSTLKLGIVHEGMAGMYTATYVNEFGCTIRKDIQVQVKHTPDVQFTKRDPVCADNQGGVFTFQFPDDPAYSGLEFSVNGEAGPYQTTSDQVGFFSITDLAVGTYDLWARWNNNECPVSLGMQDLACEASYIPLQDDSYLITARVSDKVVDVESWTAGDSANIVQRAQDSLTNQGWTITRQTGNQFRLNMDMNSLVLKVENNGMAPGTNVNQGLWLDADHQKWELQHAGNDWYFLQNVGNDLYLTVANEDSSSGANLQVEAFTGSDAQQFRFTPFSFTPLPIVDLPAFIEFDVTAWEGQAELFWTFNNPSPIKHFEVEKSFDSLSFTKLVEVPAQVDTADVQLYMALDEDPGAETVYYRVLAVGTDSNYLVSQVVRFDSDAIGGELVLFPNPVPRGENLQARVRMPGESDVTILIVEMAGRVIYTDEISLDVGMGELDIELPSGLPSGIYYFSILGEEKSLGRLFEYR